MKMTGTSATPRGESLTKAPQNLKESIDWILRLSGRDYLGGDGTDGLTTALSDFLNTAHKNEDDLMKTILSNIKKDTTSSGNGLITAVANSLKKFIGYTTSGSRSGSNYKIEIDGTGIIKPGEIYSRSKGSPRSQNKIYTSAYRNTSWSTDVTSSDDTKKKALQIFFAAIQFIFEGLTELYYNCKNGWSTHQLSSSGDSDLKEFMDRNGFSDTQLNSQLTGNQIISQALKGFNEFNAGYSAAGDNPSLDAFRSQLEQNALYILATYVYVQSTSPATSSFAGYSGLAAMAGGAYGCDLGGLATFIFLQSTCRPPYSDRPSNPKQAIDRILSVAGKDGDGGSDKSEDLERAITGLSDFTAAIEAATKKLNESGNVSQVLGKLTNQNDLGSIITKLADGLRTFIGYKDGTIKHDSQGIGLPNDPRERLGDAVLGFMAGFLGGLEMAVKNHVENVKVEKVTSNDLTGSLGGGKGKINGAIQNMSSLQYSKGKIQSVVNQLKAVSNFQSKDDMNGFADEVEKYLSGVLEAVGKDSNVTTAQSVAPNLSENVKTLKEKLIALMEKLKKQTGPFDFGKTGVATDIASINYNTSGALKPIYDALPNLKSHTTSKALVIATYMATSNFLAQLQKGYRSFYQGANADNVSNPACAKIFLSCLPLIFSNLQQLYWKCKQEKAKGGWKDMQLNGGDKKGTDLKHFMDLMTFSSVRLNGAMTGDNIVSNAFKDFNEFSTAASGQSYAEFFNKFKGNGLTTWQTTHSANEDNFLSGLYLCSSWYFQGCQMKNDSQITRPPSSIREMLYWLSGLQFAPGYSDLEKQIKSVVQPEFKVAISGSPNSDEKLTADQVKQYLVTTCLHAQTVFSTIQAPRISNHTDEPWLHSLYSNSEFNFTYPSSSSSLLYKVADYVYALQFQFQFLYKQCQFDYENGCGWWLCKFGSSVLPNDGTTVPSSFCGSVDASKGTHDGKKCGLPGGTLSPLQAFLTDKLTGFRRDPSDPYSHLAECTVGSMCHVPMGFKPKNLRSLATGGHLMIALNFFCGKSNTPLTKLCHTLSCVAKRTPRTLGDMFGFTFHLTGQMFREAIKQSDPSNKINSALTNLITRIPETIKVLFFDVTSDLEKMGSRFFDLSLHCHKVTTPSTVSKRNGPYCDHHNGGTEKAADLASLFGCTNGNTCGKYLEPLGISSGATFANDFASTYLTWALYLTDDIYESFQGFLDRFSSLKCTGCKNDPQCNSHNPGDHSSQCKCPSIVQCADALTVLYEYGFHFQDTFWLKGWRNCTTFANQLQAVINGNPLNTFLSTIDTFLYAIRWEFFYNQSAFWAIYIGLILYTFLFLLDTLHLRSHLKLTSSHMVPPLALLTSGNPLPVTKLTYIGQ
ncbi:variant erythrocyte surface antigen-1 family protein [Babesia caballi]|uniref:Variant erythrocyte surface antigen-1 family protein n=1 Tax=Babesia caballi TaxID=5871 RepID=A0AAV4LVX8_BABCB|nr:variant erythrocyte surface antigen-1 family protein [Babesia caballi]